MLPVVQTANLGLLLLAASALILIAGAELFAEHAAGAGRRLRISAVAVALLLAGAEPEEMVTALIAALDGRPELAAGDAIGANVTMFTLALGVAALACFLRTRPAKVVSRRDSVRDIIPTYSQGRYVSSATVT